MLDYVAVPESFKLPPGMNFGGTSGIAINPQGNLFVLHRGPKPLMEFDPDGNFIRGCRRVVVDAQPKEGRMVATYVEVVDE